MKTEIKNRHGMIVSFALIVTMTMVLSSMAAVMADGTRQDDELILRVAMQDDLKTTNPLTAGDVWTWNVIGYLYDGPVNADPETDDLVPYIAVGSANLSTTIDYTAGELGWDDCEVGVFGFTPKDTWQHEVPTSKVGEAIIFYDFTGVTWHDGVQITIRDVMFS
ncbi:MAG: hypothetical protein KAX31_07365, partial [Thermoplasmata archaeon]|nr:hypothetical protein [Thermoplasmata archaeon]